MALKPIRARLLKGATVLAQLWKEGKRCPEGWRDVECSCTSKEQFCKAKAQWINLAIQDGRIPYGDEYSLALFMLASEWDATGMVLKVEVPGTGVIAIGSKGTVSMKEFWKLALTPESLPSFLEIFKVFPGSKIAGIEQKPVEPEDPFPKEEGAH